jgi:hypothetical protein
MSLEAVSPNNKSDRENNLSSAESDETPKKSKSIDPLQSILVSKNLISPKSNEEYYHEDSEFEYYRVPKKESDKKERKQVPEPVRDFDSTELMQKISLDNIPDFQDVSFKGSSLAGSSALNLRF